MIEKTVFSDDEIVAQIKSNYNIITKDIEHEDRGSANIFYITDDENKKYVFKEFESRCKEEKILKEAQIVDFLKSKNISVPEYVKTVDNKYYFKYKNRIVILMKYITGYTKKPNTGSYEQVIECANLHGRVLKALENYEKLEQSDVTIVLSAVSHPLLLSPSLSQIWLRCGFRLPFPNVRRPLLFAVLPFFHSPAQ